MNKKFWFYIYKGCKGMIDIKPATFYRDGVRGYTCMTVFRRHNGYEVSFDCHDRIKSEYHSSKRYIHFNNLVQVYRAALDFCKVW